MGLWLILKKILILKGNEILNYIWVYAYKFNKVKWFIKYKAKLIIKGDQ